MSELEPTRTYSNPTATDVLRRLLDERGVEWENSKPYGAKAVTRFKVNDVWLRYVEYGDYQWLDYHENEPLTPEQAIVATLGSCNCSDNCTNSERTETCHEIEDEDTGFIVCSECGAVHDESYTAYYCWCCGRRIEQ